MQNCMMFDRARDDMLTLGSIGICCCFQCPVIRLASAACKIDLICLRIDQLCNRCSRLINCFLALACETVDSRWIAINF